MKFSASFGGWEKFLLAVLVVIIATNALMSPFYLTVGNQVNLFQLSIEKVIVATVMMMVIVSGEIDVSVASVMGLGACVTAWMFNQGLPMEAAIAGGLAAGVIAGSITGFSVAYLGLPSLVVTLAGLIGFRGLARVFLEDRAIGGFPGWFTNIGQTAAVGPLTSSILLFALMMVIVGVVMHRTAYGRAVYVIGNGAEVARFSGVEVRRIKFLLFVLSGFVAALAGILYAARLGSVRGDMAQGFELEIITIVLLGGISSFGGSGGIIGLALSVLVILNLRNGMGLASITANTQSIVIGALLIVSAVAPNTTRIFNMITKRE